MNDKYVMPNEDIVIDIRKKKKIAHQIGRKKNWS